VAQGTIGQILVAIDHNPDPGIFKKDSFTIAILTDGRE